MYCSNCGKAIPADSLFCPYCGSRNEAASVTATTATRSVSIPVQHDPVAERRSLRSSEVAEIERMIRHFSSAEALYNEYDALCDKLDPRNRKKKVGLLVGGIILAVIGLYGTIFGTMLSSRSGDAFGIILGIMLMAGGAVMITAFVITSKARNTNYSEAFARFDQVSNELFQHYLDYGPCLVSAEYTNPSNLAAIRDTIISGRADTIKEAVNTLIEDAHRTNMEAFARQTAISSANAARGSTAAAVFSAANLFLRR